MTTRDKAQVFVDSQRSLRLYKEAREAFVDVLTALPEEVFDMVTHNLILTVLHEGAIAQVMHFEPVSEQFRVLQLTIPQDVPRDVLRWVIAHEFGHVLQGRNWQEGDGDTLEDDATARALQWGFEKTPEVRYRQRFAQRI